MYGIFTYMWLPFIVNVDKYTSPMDPMGMVSTAKPARVFVGKNLPTRNHLAAVLICGSKDRKMDSFDACVTQDFLSVKV